MVISRPRLSRPSLTRSRSGLPVGAGRRARRTRPARLGMVAVAASAAALAAACGGVTHVSAPILTVVTTVYPVAQAASEVGAGQVHVIDLTRPGVDPRTMTLTAAQVAEVHKASLVVDVGGGFQPSVEAAAKGAKRVLSLSSALGVANPYVWLDPHLMLRASTLLSKTLTTIEPSAKSVFTNGQEDYTAVVSSLDIDYTNSLSDCPNSTFVTSDDAFAQMADQYGVHDKALGTTTAPSTAQVSAATAAIRDTSVNAAFTEPYVNGALLTLAAEAAGVKVKSLNTLVTAPASGSAAEVSYSNMMEEDLSALSSALQCPAMGED